ncbi:MAG: Gfo/Idh/MocA family oxidoreductase [Candidatus Glassbacteria bacterium]|nr:Gfo/Idh/MocA family oxidoreductase [Candidatus Glassbacteria bacterium]
MQDNPGAINRRQFIRNTSAAAAALGAAALSNPFGASAAQARTRVALVGTGIRGSTTWGKNLLRDEGDKVEIVGLCDINPDRVQVANRWMGGKIPTFTDFDEMINTTRPERVIVTTVDSTHYQYVCRAMELGVDPISEKPLCTHDYQAQQIVDTQKRTGRKLDVTFNARHGASSMKVKELLLDGEIGELYSVSYEEFLDLEHGASYFRRWHGLKQASGTLLCHKASHHFDELNWWIDADPVEVIAYGRLNKYGSKGPLRHSNCRACPFKKECDLYWDITTNQDYMELYVDCEDQDGYYRDGCLYRRAINIPDTYSVQIKYDNNVLVNYSLNATVPYEGQYIVFNGSKGRLDLRNYDRQPWDVPYESEIRLTHNFKGSKVITVDPQRGEFFEHGGADQRIKAMIFDPSLPDPLNQRAGMRAGILSSAIGIAGYTSIDTGRRVRIDEVVKL